MAERDEASRTSAEDTKGLDHNRFDTMNASGGENRAMGDWAMMSDINYDEKKEVTLVQGIEGTLDSDITGFFQGGVSNRISVSNKNSWKIPAHKEGGGGGIKESENDKNDEKQ